jgi:hypothetical protein
MDIIQALIETENAGRSGWRIVNNGGALGFLNNRTSNVLFSILNDGGIGTSSNVPSNFINSYSNINIITNYYSSSNISIGSGSSSQWTTSGVKIYYNTSNIGIGTIDPITPLQIYNITNSRLLLDATTTGTATVEFRRGIGVDMQNDFRFINDTNNSLKLQYENSTQVFGNTTTNLLWFSSNETIIHKNTSMYGRVGIGTVYNSIITSRTLDVVGDANISGVMTIGSLNVSSNAIITNNITSNVSLTIQNSVVPSPPNEIIVSPLPNEIVVAGTTSGIIDAYRYVTFPYSGSGITKDYTFTTTENILCDILIVGGGGGGGYDRAGGGGAGGLLLYTNTTINIGTYTIKVGKGGAGATSASISGTNGSPSSIDELSGFIALGGGGGASANPGLVSGIGGSGGGGAGNTGWGANTGGVGTSGQGNKGGNSVDSNSGGGSGAGGVGGNGVSGTNPGNSGNGGVGLNMSSYFGTSVGQSGWFAGGGGGALNYDNFSSSANSTSSRGGQGGGGNAGLARGQSGSSGLSGTGGGGGGGANIPQGSGGTGGSGIIIIRYRKPPNEVVHETISGIIGTDRYTVFPYSGTGATKDYSLTMNQNYACDILVVGGGGAGGTRIGGGGGAGALIYVTNQTITSGIYTIKVGRGGIGAINNINNPPYAGEAGKDSEIFNSINTVIYRAKGGGGGDTNANSATISNSSVQGGSSGGIAGNFNNGANNYISSGISPISTNILTLNGTTTTVAPNNTSVYGYAGGGGYIFNGRYMSGGGGGAGSVGQSVNTTAFIKSGNGGSAISISILGSSVAYAGGGGAGGGRMTNATPFFEPGTGGSINGIQVGGNGGYLKAATTFNSIAYPAEGVGGDGVANTGSGGGGSGTDDFSQSLSTYKGGSGGSGIIIIRYRKLPTEIVISGTTSTIIGATDRCISFPYSGSGTIKDYSFTTTEILNVDILVVAGGGGGGSRHAGGGGAGAVIYLTNQTFSLGTYSINVGSGGTGAQNMGQGTKGNDSSIIFNTNNTIILAKGGGAGFHGESTGGTNRDGGSGGGNGYINEPIGVAVSTNIPVGTYGYSGGDGANSGVASSWAGGGGGGSGGVGSDSVLNGNFATAGKGGDGRLISITGDGLYYGGGGGGGSFSTATAAGLGGNGGGGAGSKGSNRATNGNASTGGGGGGGGFDDSYNGIAGNGGSGIIIIRYRIPLTTSSSINFIRGTATDTNNDYKIGNFNREFKIVSSTSNVDTDYIRITTTGAITNPTGTTSWNTGSDRRIKENIERASYDKCYENINKLELNRFNYIKGFNTINRDKTQLGFIAQEVYDIFPKAISSQEYYSNTLSIPDLLSVDVTQINYSLYGAVKKLIEINNEKDTLLKTLDDELKTIETILNITLEPSSSNVVLEEASYVSTSNIIDNT